MSGFTWGLTPSGKEPDKPEPDKPEPEDDPFAIFTPRDPDPEPKSEPELPPTEAMPTSQEPYRPAPAAPVEPPAEPFVFPPAAPFVPQQPQHSAPQHYSPPPFRPPSQYPSPYAAAPPTVASPSGPAATSAPTSGIDAIFGESAFREYDDPSLLTALPTRRNPEAPREPRAPLGQNQRILIGIAAGLVAALVLVLVFVLGTHLPGLVPAASTPTPSAPAPKPTKSVAPTTGTLAPGVHAWNTLNGGECIDPFDTAWATEFTVVDCAQGHGAQLLTKAAFTDASFPGADALAKEAKTACVSSKVIDYATAGAYDDLRLSSSYATTQAEWDGGFTNFYCFVSRPDRQIDGSLSKVAAG